MATFITTSEGHLYNLDMIVHAYEHFGVYCLFADGRERHFVNEDAKQVRAFIEQHKICLKTER